MNINFNPYYNCNNTNTYKQDFAFRGAPKVSLEKIRFLIEEEHKHVKDIAALYDTSTQTIYNILAKFGIKSPKELAESELGRQIRELLNSSDNPPRSMAEIARKIGVSTFIISRWFKENNIVSPRLQRRERYLFLLKSSLPDNEIAEKLGIKIISLHTLRRKSGIKAWRVRKEDKVIPVINELRKGVSKEEVAKKFNISKDTIYRYINWYKNNME